MTGYLYQCELALLELARHSWQDATVEVRMELLDDIEFLDPQDNTPRELLQSKHREAAGPLSETGKDFWRSVASWIDALKALSDRSETSMPLLRLVSTQIAIENTFLHQLRPGAGRDASKALARMEEVAKDEDGPDGTAKDRALFMGLTPAQRHQLVSAITVNDGAPVMSDLDSSLAKELGITPSGHAQAALDEIKGWWYGMAVRLLERKNRDRMLPSVKAEQLMCRRDEIIGRYAGKSLPITQKLNDLTQAEISGYADRLVVTQMRWIGLPDDEVAMHLRDYHYARAQRSEWLRTFKVTPERLEEYEGELHYEWETAFRRRTRRIRDDMSEADRQCTGQEILDDTMDRVADTPLNPGSVTAPWIGKGSIHGLSDQADTADADRAVGWHPDYGQLCKRRNETQEQ
ncbi:ABC-three component system protein [Streptomyces sp. NBC_00258]|uniref:ABC-three component system protein n=1 Tax=Streptomyces sp. NBC_00258 TaxID=2903642 RepID=UPI002E27B940|nr:ABC-three component system protein [Streptomyces sp. NBC_00258]